MFVNKKFVLYQLLYNTRCIYIQKQQHIALVAINHVIQRSFFKDVVPEKDPIWGLINSLNRVFLMSNRKRQLLIHTFIKKNQYD